MNRITDEEILTAYLLTGRQPCRRAYLLGERWACPLSALALMRGVPEDKVRYGVVGAPGFSHAYLEGFIHGYDGNVMLPAEWREYRKGYSDGRAMFDLLSERYPVLTAPSGASWSTSSAAASITKMTLTLKYSGDVAFTW